jgi:hypothetical protein
LALGKVSEKLFFQGELCYHAAYEKLIGSVEADAGLDNGGRSSRKASKGQTFAGNQHGEARERA